MLGILTTLETGSPGAVAAALGILVLEEGSLVFNIWSADGQLSAFPECVRPEVRRRLSPTPRQLPIRSLPIRSN